MTRKFPGSLVGLILVVLLGGCVSGGSVPTPFNYGGTWSGSIQDSMAGAGTVALTMSQSGGNLFGTWQATFSNGGNGGTLAGVVNGNEVLVELYPSNPNFCPYAVVATRSGSGMNGTYAAYNCLDTVTGTLNVSK
jgi:hypothetical protein